MYGEQQQVWDYGFDYYAPQSFETEDGRRIHISWMGMPDCEEYTNPTIQTGWQHCFTFPREIFEKDGKICLQEAEPEVVTKTEALSALTDLMTLEDGRLKLSGYNQEELLELAQAYPGDLSFRSENRTAMIYIDRK